MIDFVFNMATNIEEGLVCILIARMKVFFFLI